MLAKHHEIERKFLVKTMPELVDGRVYAIRQGYLTQDNDSIEVRLRQKADCYFLTVKSGAGMIRSEREIIIDAVQFDVLWPLTQGRRIEKQRWTGRLANKLQFELDVYIGALAPLVLVEVEFNMEEEAERFEPPVWFGREVTYDKRYKNNSLATKGLIQGLD